MKTMNDGDENWVYFVESDPALMSRPNLLLRVLIFLATMCAVILSLAWWIDHCLGAEPWLPVLIASCVGAPFIGGLFHSRVRRSVRQGGVWIGRDFIAGPRAAACGGTAFARYADIVGVTLDAPDGDIVGAIIHARRTTVIVARWIKNPGIVVREIFEHAPERVKWRRSWRPFTRLSREKVAALIEAAHLPDIHSPLPYGVSYASADDLFSRERPQGKGWFARSFAERPTRELQMVSLQTPTPAGRYVNFMLLQMLETGETTRTLRRSDLLPVLTFRAESVEPPPIEAVVDHLKARCGLNPKRIAGPANGMFHIQIQKVPCDILCRFDEGRDESCEIRLEKVQDKRGTCS